MTGLRASDIEWLSGIVETHRQSGATIRAVCVRASPRSAMPWAAVTGVVVGWIVLLASLQLNLSIMWLIFGTGIAGMWFAREESRDVMFSDGTNLTLVLRDPDEARADMIAAALGMLTDAPVERMPRAMQPWVMLLGALGGMGFGLPVAMFCVFVSMTLSAAFAPKPVPPTPYVPPPPTVDPEKVRAEACEKWKHDRAAMVESVRLSVAKDALDLHAKSDKALCDAVDLLDGIPKAKQTAEVKAVRARLKAAISAARMASYQERVGWSPLLCRDGTLSESCTCSGPRRGCCSHHGGVAGCDALPPPTPEVLTSCSPVTCPH